jgi:hypothetical protein
MARDLTRWAKPSQLLIQREPDNATCAAAIVALGWLSKCTSKLPVLGFIAPLNSGKTENVV